jgi:hypothetical protein
MSQEYSVIIKPRKIRLCIEPDCKAIAQGKTEKCVAHGGGARCIEPDCKVSAIGKTNKCKRHGGGPRCIEQI